MKKKDARTLEELHSWAEGPNWRWKIAQESAQKRFTRHTDALVKRTADFLRRQSNIPAGQCDVSDRDVDIAEAVRLNHDEATTDLLKILTLGRCDRSEIAQRLRLDESHILTWELLFFDVRAAHGAVTWIQARIISPLEAAGRLGLVARLRLVSSAGPVAARAIMDADVQMPLDPGQRVFAKQLKLDLKVQEALAFPVTNERQSMQLIVLSAKIRAAEKRLELDKAKLEARCQEAVRKHELAVLRVEVANQNKQTRSRQRDGKRSRTQQAAREHNRTEEMALLRAYEEAARAAAQERALASPLAQLTWSSSATAKAQSIDAELMTPVESEGEIVTLDWTPRVDEVPSGEVDVPTIHTYCGAAS